MPKGKEPSWPVQKLILELLPLHGNQPVVIQRSLDALIRQKGLIEDTPGIKWIEKTIAKLQELDLDVLAELPPSVWKQRHDYEEIRLELERLAKAGGNIGPLIFEQGLRAHTESVLNLLDAYARQLKVSYDPENLFILDALVVGPPILEKEPTFAAVEGHYKHTKLGEDIIKYKQAVDAYRSAVFKLRGAVVTKDCLIRDAKVSLELLRKVVRIKLAPVRFELYLRGIETDQTILERFSEVLNLRGQSGTPLQQLLEFVGRYKDNMDEEGEVIIELLGRLQENYEIMKRLEKAITRDIEEEKLRGILPPGTKCKFCPPAIIEEADSTIRGGAL